MGPDNVAITAGYCGLIPAPYPLNSIFQLMSGPEEAVIRIAVKPDSGIGIERLKSELRKEMPEQLGAWLRDKMRAEGFAGGTASSSECMASACRSSRRTSSTRS